MERLNDIAEGTLGETLPKRYECYWTEYDQCEWKPITREGATFVQVNKKLVLFGGLNRDQLADIAVLDPVGMK